MHKSTMSNSGNIACDTLNENEIYF